MRAWFGRAILFPDFTRKASREWWGSLYADFVKAPGFWNDMDEPAIFLVPSKTMPEYAASRRRTAEFTTRVGVKSLEVHNIYGMQIREATFEGLLGLGRCAAVVMTRATFAGGHRYAVLGRGTIRAPGIFAATTPQLLNLGLSGFAQGGRGRCGALRSPELLTRGGVPSIDRHRGGRPRSRAERHRRGCEPAAAVHRRALSADALPLHDYRRDEPDGAAHHAAVFCERRAEADGGPLDLSTGNAFMVGPDLLVAQGPYPDELDDYHVRLPPSSWYDYWTGSN